MAKGQGIRLERSLGVTEEVLNRYFSDLLDVSEVHA